MDTMKCYCLQDRNVVRTRECCCEPIKMNNGYMHDLYRLEAKTLDFACSWEEVPLLSADRF